MIQITRNNHTFESELLLGPSKYAILPFRKLCYKLGADSIIVEVSSNKDINFLDDEKIVASVKKKTLLKQLDAHPAVKALIVPEALIVDARKLSSKPLISTKNADILEARTVSELPSSVSSIPYLLYTKEKSPEELNSFITKTSAKALVLLDVAIPEPVIFEQTKNYFEKGYYNKITRKRREKTVAEFKKMVAKYGGDAQIVSYLSEAFLQE